MVSHTMRHGDDAILSALANKSLMLATWVTFSVVVGIYAIWHGGRLDTHSQFAVWALFAEGAAVVVFGLYRSLFFNVLSGVAVTAVSVLVLPGFVVDGGRLSDGLRLLAILIGCFSLTGVGMVLMMGFTMIQDARSQKE